MGVSDSGEARVAEPDQVDYVYRSVARVTVPAELVLHFAGEPGEADLTISPGIDRHNFELLQAGTRLAYPRAKAVWWLPTITGRT